MQFGRANIPCHSCATADASSPSHCSFPETRSLASPFAGLPSCDRRWHEDDHRPTPARDTALRGAPAEEERSARISHVPCKLLIQSNLSCWILLMGPPAIRQAVNRSIVPVDGSVITSAGMTRGCLRAVTLSRQDGFLRRKGAPSFV
jgi:hypothetical protein